MEGLVDSRFHVTNAVRKKRSNTSRRPRPDTSTFLDSRDQSPSSSTPPSESAGKVSSDENVGNNIVFRKKEISLNGSASRHSSIIKSGGGSSPRKFWNDNEAFGEVDGFTGKNGSGGGSYARYEQTQNTSDFKRCSEGVLSPANWKRMSTMKNGFDILPRSHSSKNGRNADTQNPGQPGMSICGIGNRGDTSSHENKLRKVKLKVGGITHTIHANAAADSGNGGPYVKSSHPSDSPRVRQKMMLQDDLYDEQSPPNKIQKIQRKGFHGGKLAKSKGDQRSKMSGHVLGKQSHGNETSSDPVRKSKRVPKRRVLDGAFDGADEDDEIQYLERLKTAKTSLDYISEFRNHGDENNRKEKSSKMSRRKLAGDEYEDDVAEYGSLRTSRETKRKSRLGKESEDTDYIDDEDEDEAGSGVGYEAKRKKQKKELVGSLMDGKKEISLTTRQRALQSVKDASVGASLIEFPNGLPPAPPRKQKEKLSEVEQQLKRAEAAQRRRMQNEKAALESQKEAIRKILGQDSSRKKREDAKKKRQDELAQEKAANSMMLASNTVRWVMGPTGTTVTFPIDVGLPIIFDSKCSYPPPREKCAGPACTNVYKYRDSKLKLPLCSLQCYRAIHEAMKAVTTC